MIRRPPLRFLALVLGGWVVARAAWLMPWPATSAPRVWQTALPPMERLSPAPMYVAAVPVPGLRVQRRPSALRAPRLLSAIAVQPADGAGSRGVLLREAEVGAIPWVQAPGPVPLPDPAAPSARLHGSAYLFARSGSGRAALAPGGQLGGSQAGLRVTLPIVRGIAAAARVAMPLHDPSGAEAAVGFDWQPLAQLALRVSGERRVALGGHARDAWSLYAAGGGGVALGGGYEVDGYAQAGMVGARRRDLFADAALRAGHRRALDATHTLTLGGGVWGAAQPGVARLDLGPRAALGMRLGGAAASLALEARLRVAGRAAPGSGVALTLASDF